MHPLDVTLEPLRKLWFKFQKDKSERWYSHTTEYSDHDCNISDYLSKSILSQKALMLTRLGTSELHTMLTYLNKQESLLARTRDFLTGRRTEFWWGDYAYNDLAQNSGFFPVTTQGLELFAELYLQELPKVDILLSWLKGEKFFQSYLRNTLKKLYIFDVEPYHFPQPWTMALKGKKVLVIHPFEDSIKVQYEKRQLLFEASDTLPEFELITLKAVQSIKGNPTNFQSWFDGLNYMKQRMSEIDFDIALIAAGAYGLPLAAFAKDMGKQGFHLGGFLQIIFGIRGKRWEQSKDHRHLVNKHWKFPYQHEYPFNYQKLDRGSYW
jgi:hypothetical protein